MHCFIKHANEENSKSLISIFYAHIKWNEHIYTHIFRYIYIYIMSKHSFNLIWLAHTKHTDTYICMHRQ